jgi:micrococcal nuclease
MEARVEIAVLSVLVFALALASAGCPGRVERTAADGGYDPVGGNPFEGLIAFDDERVAAIDPTVLPAAPLACRPPLLAVVSRIDDGDTIDVVALSDGEELRIRMTGVGAPEIAHPPATVVNECFGIEATIFTELLRERLVWLTFDEDCLDDTESMRTLAYVWIGSGEGDLWQRQLLRRGFAEEFGVAPNFFFRPTFESDQAIAREAGLGMWSACP